MTYGSKSSPKMCTPERQFKKKAKNSRGFIRESTREKDSAEEAEKRQEPRKLRERLEGNRR